MSQGSQAEVARVLAASPMHRELLRVVAALRLPQGCVAAGMVRNAVWDVLHERAPALHPRSDVDVIYFDPDHATTEHEASFEQVLARHCPEIPWQVRNQARMHARNADPAYQSARDALRYFPETATAISARWQDGEVIVEAPLGVLDLFELVVRPTRSFESKPEVYRARARSKDWRERWPRLRFLEPALWPRV